MIEDDSGLQEEIKREVDSETADCETANQRLVTDDKPQEERTSKCELDE